MFGLFNCRRILLVARRLIAFAVIAQAAASAGSEPVQGAQEPAGIPSAQAAASSTRIPVAITVEAGTRVLMALKSPLHTTSGVQGSGIYLETVQPVVQGDRVVIPAHSQVQGVVESNQRPGHFRRTAEFKFRFTTLIFPNSHTVSINGALQSIPGAKDVRTRPRSEGLQTVDQADKAVAAAAAGATGGAIFGSVSHFGIGKFAGAGLGAGLALEAVLLQRGDAISLSNGTHVEMVLQSPFVLEPEQAAFNAQYVAPPSAPQNASSDEDARKEKPLDRPRRRAARPVLFPGLPVGFFSSQDFDR